MVEKTLSPSRPPMWSPNTSPAGWLWELGGGGRRPASVSVAGG